MRSIDCAFDLPLTDHSGLMIIITFQIVGNMPFAIKRIFAMREEVFIRVSLALFSNGRSISESGSNFPGQARW